MAVAGKENEMAGANGYQETSFKASRAQSDECVNNFLINMKNVSLQKRPLLLSERNKAHKSLESSTESRTPLLCRYIGQKWIGVF